MKFMLYALVIFLSYGSIHSANNQTEQSIFNEPCEYTTSKEVKSMFSVFAFNQKRFGKKKGKVEQIVAKFVCKKKPLIIANDWSQEDYMVISFIIFLSKRLDLATKTFEIKKYNNWIFGNVPPLEELSRGITHFNPLPEWRSWWEKEGDSKKILKQINEIYLSITNTPDTFRFSDKSASNKITKPFLSLAYIFSREMIKDKALIKNISRNSYREEVIKNLETKKNEFNSELNLENPNIINEQSLKLEKDLYKSDHISLFKKAYNHVLFVKKKRNFNSENGDNNIELLPNWWEKELDIVTAIILTIFKYQYRHRMQIIEAENKIKNDNLNWKKIHNCIKQAIFCTSNGSSNNSLEHIPIWHRFGEKWQSFPQGAMIRILDNVSKLSLKTSGWDVYDYVICLCFYYLIKRERIRIDWFTLGPLSGSPRTRFWRRFKRYVINMFSSNKGMFDMNNKWYSSPVELELE
ncbi:unnamed protein product [Cryptosporidium hominis]|uniref:Uncharacterized protein n=1 Tax=Cryptosporidium hominis TaxID=237895 RepID=A0A0S4TF77_CRYHO|nr:hypothetical protein [Cryptosporidium hominis TU502]PPS93499.1 Uncharacterized protein GY17_00003600 [Cryptosporidium hominis]CUV06141.1 unnamed protein product [Cryptosporidium hominis]|eukprot:PPS93499.1 Uncharacterized protein GY17_00003600 [Cryptosporidium hominis]